MACTRLLQMLSNAASCSCPAAGPGDMSVPDTYACNSPIKNDAHGFVLGGLGFLGVCIEVGGATLVVFVTDPAAGNGSAT